MLNIHAFCKPYVSAERGANGQRLVDAWSNGMSDVDEDDGWEIDRTLTRRPQEWLSGQRPRAKKIALNDVAMQREPR